MTTDTRPRTDPAARAKCVRCGNFCLSLYNRDVARDEVVMCMERCRRCRHCNMRREAHIDVEGKYPNWKCPFASTTYAPVPIRKLGEKS